VDERKTHWRLLHTADEHWSKTYKSLIYTTSRARSRLSDW
jgi:hypothetical protein